MVGGDSNSVVAVTNVSIQIKQEAFFYFFCLCHAYTCTFIQLRMSSRRVAVELHHVQTQLAVDTVAMLKGWRADRAGGRAACLPCRSRNVAHINAVGKEQEGCKINPLTAIQLWKAQYLRRCWSFSSIGEGKYLHQKLIREQSAKTTSYILHTLEQWLI